MNETTIHSLPDGRWELRRAYDTLAQAADAATILLADQWPDDRVEVAEPPTAPTVTTDDEWDGVFRVGDEGVNGFGQQYTVTQSDDMWTYFDRRQPIIAKVNGVCDNYAADGQYARRPSGFDLMPPTKRGPKV